MFRTTIRFRVRDKGYGVVLSINTVEGMYACNVINVCVYVYYVCIYVCMYFIYLNIHCMYVGF